MRSQSDIDEPSFDIVAYEPDKHQNFILDSWLKSFKVTKLAKHSAREDYYPIQQAIIKAILRSATVKMATSDGEFVGYVVADKSCLHYVYVKHALRRFGVASRLLDEFPSLECFSTFIDAHWKSHWLHHKRGLRFSYYKSLAPMFIVHFDGPIWEIPVDNA